MNRPTPTEEVMLYGNRFLTEDAPDGPFPETGMSALDAMRLVAEELAIEGDPNKNLKPIDPNTPRPKPAVEGHGSSRLAARDRPASAIK